MGKRPKKIRGLENFYKNHKNYPIKGREKYPPLEYFFVAYFEEIWDWVDADAPTSTIDMLAIFFEIETAEMLETIAQGIDDLLDTNPTEEEAQSWYEKHTRSKASSHDGLTTLSWIRYMRTKLEQPLREKIKERDKRLEVAKKFWDNQKNIKPKKS